MSSQEVKDYTACLLDEKEPIAKRMRTVFLLKQIGSEEAIAALAKALPSPSVLLAHETAYCMGQLRNTYAIPFLTAALEDSKLDTIVRHEAGEALGAICSPESIPVLEKYVNSDIRELAETCQIAVDLIRLKQDKDYKETSDPNGIFHSHDPAPPAEETDINVLRTRLLDSSLPLFKRYRAMFSLRNLCSDEAVLALAEGFSDSSTLFKHEIAYVFGQMCHRASIPALKAVLQDAEEHPMVRHEAAEALGGIGDDSITAFLQSFQHDSNPIVRYLTIFHLSSSLILSFQYSLELISLYIYICLCSGCLT